MNTDKQFWSYLCLSVFIRGHTVFCPPQGSKIDAEWKPREPRYKTGVFAKYCKLVSSASEGAVTRV